MHRISTSSCCSINATSSRSGRLRSALSRRITLILQVKCVLSWSQSCARWLYILSKEFPTLAFHASLSKSFGKGSLIQLLRQFQHLHNDKKQISVGFFGALKDIKFAICNNLKVTRTSARARSSTHFVERRRREWRQFLVKRR